MGIEKKDKIKQKIAKYQLVGFQEIKDSIIIGGGSTSPKFHGKIYGEEIHGLTVDNPIVYENCEFELPVRFELTKFKSTVDFKNCIFHKDVEFNCDFNFVKFEDVAFKDVVRFDSPLENLCKFKKVTFEMDLIFYCSSVKDKKIEFTSCNFNTIAYFRNLNFGNDVLFNRCNLTNCSFLYSYIEYIRFQDCEFDFKNLIDEKNLSIPKHDFTKKDIITLYRHFEINLDKYKDFDTAGEFHKKRLELDRSSHKKISLRWLLLTFYKWTSDYGENYSKSLRKIIYVVIIFSFIYLYTGISYSNYNIWWWDYSKPQLFTDWGSSFLYSLISSSPIRRDSEVIKSLGGWTTGFSVLQTIIQTILGTLFIIGIRRKFKR